MQCVPTERDAYDRLLAHCSVNGIDLSTWSAASGWSWAFVRYSDRLLPEEQAARAQKLRTWAANDVQAPWENRQSRWGVAAQTASDGCPVKGNISPSGEKIYHVAWNGQFYDRTKIGTGKGERWFCSEAEAIAAG